MKSSLNDIVSLQARNQNHGVGLVNGRPPIRELKSQISLISSRRIDEIRVLLPTASDKLSSHLNPDLVALVGSLVSFNISSYAPSQ